MKLTFCLLFVFFTTVFSELAWSESEETESSNPPRRSLHDLSSTKGSNRRHVEHIDAKWDTSDMDSDEGVHNNRRSLFFRHDKNQKNKLSKHHLNLAKLMPYVRTVVGELVRKLDGTSWESIGKNILGIVDGLIDIINKTERAHNEKENADNNNL